MLEELEIRSLREIINAVRDNYAYDMSDFAQASLKHRIVTFANKVDISDPARLAERLGKDENLFDGLLEHMTVPVTELFRDPSFWRGLRNSIFPRFADLNKVNVWVPGCASGHELWSLLIALSESNLLHRTDVLITGRNEKLLEKGLSGLYLIADMELAANNYQRFEGKQSLTDYYTVEGQFAQFDHNLLKNVKTEVLLHDQGHTPSGRFHFILGRNLMIYYNNSLQEKTQQLFCEKLEKKGVLAIGNKENIIGRKANEQLVEINPEEKLYRKL